MSPVRVRGLFLPLCQRRQTGRKDRKQKTRVRERERGGKWSKERKGVDPREAKNGEISTFIAFCFIFTTNKVLFLVFCALIILNKG